ncbi:MAG: TerB family tellurite resistance protein [Gemmatimonadetes bacterium]|nr:TerB family tellurite resistance protein [Gemmatimonadota bacterium]
MFLESIRALFGSGSTGSDEPELNGAARADARHVAACALLLEIAHADGEFSQAEREHLESVLVSHFSLDAAAGRELLQLAESERSASIDHHRFTTLLRTGYDFEQKMSLAESMWGLVLADGDIADHEHYLTRKIANLLDLQPAELSAAKAAAAARSRLE